MSRKCCWCFSRRESPNLMLSGEKEGVVGETVNEGLRGL